MAQFVKNLASSKRAYDAFQQLNWTDNTDLSVSSPITLSLPGKVNTWSYDPVQSLFACATNSGDIHLWGAPPVYISWSISTKCAVKHLAFAPGRGILVAIDSKESIHVYSLSELEKNVPKQIFVHYLRSNVLCIETSPSLDHMFIGFADGTVETFDMDRLCIAPYRISNIWLIQEEVLRRSGVSNAPSRRHIPMCIDMALNPVDLNQILLAYEGGIALYDIKENKSLATFDMVLAPGAAGSGNDSSSHKFTERRPPVTSIAWKPDGLIFAVGHLDGCISFWAVHDADRPVMVRTMDRSNVDMPTEEDIFDDPEDDGKKLDLRDPIYRLAWSAYPDDSQSKSALQNGCTTLTIFGGLRASQNKGVQVMTFPRFHPPSSSINRDSLSSTDRTVYKEALTPISITYLQTKHIPQDFILLPRSNPHFSGCYDPVSILLMVEPLSSASNNPCPRRLLAYKFPPEEPGNVFLETSLPLPDRWHWSGDTSVISSQLYSTSHNRVQSMYDESNAHTLFQGGKASPLHGGNVNFARKASRLPARLLVSKHGDGYIRFWDCSDALLASPESSGLHSNVTSMSTSEKRLSLGASVFSGWLKKPFPRLLNTLKIPGSNVIPAESVKFCFSCEKMLCALAIPNGVVHIFRLFSSHEKSSAEDATNEDLASQILDEFDDDFHRNLDVGDSPMYEAIHDQASRKYPGFKKIGKLILPSLKVDLLDISDFGFLTATWENEIAVLNIEEEDVFYRKNEVDNKKSKGKENNGTGNICSIVWTFSATGRINVKALRLLCAYQDGTFEMITFNNTLDTWHMASETDIFHHKGVYDPFLTVVLNPNGTMTSIDDIALLSEDLNLEDKDLRSIMIVVTSNAIHVFINIDGYRAKVIETPTEIIDAKVVRSYDGNTTLIALFVDGNVSGYSLPRLDDFVIEYAKNGDRKWLSRDVALGSDGSFIKCIGSDKVKLYNIGPFDQEKIPIYPPALHLHDSTLKAPTHPCEYNAVASTISSWFGAVSVAEAVDSTLGGASRPQPKVPVEKGSQNKSQARVPEPLKSPTASQSTTSQQSQMSITDRASKSATSAIQRARDAIEERGEHLNRLSESINDMSRSSKNALDEARNVAFKESAKGKLRSWFG